jgi:hypothetical protein
LRVAKPATRSEALTSTSLVEHLPAMTSHQRLRPDYSEAFLEWLFDQMARVKSRGTLVRQLVRDEGGRALGWYVAYMQPGGVSQVQQIAAKPQDVGAVMDHLLYHACEIGSSILRGRLDPMLFESVRQAHCYLRYDLPVLIHSRDAAITNAIRLGDACLTRMEGEWWMGHHTEPFVADEQ